MVRPPPTWRTKICIRVRRTRGVRDQTAVGRERGIDLEPRIARDLHGLADGERGVAVAERAG